MIAEVNTQIRVHMVICRLVLIKVVLSVTYFHNGYKILVYVIDYKNLKCICLRNVETIKVILTYMHPYTKFGHVVGIAYVFFKLWVYHYVKFGNHYTCLSFLQWYFIKDHHTFFLYFY